MGPFGAASHAVHDRRARRLVGLGLVCALLLSAACAPARRAAVAQTAAGAATAAPPVPAPLSVVPQRGWSDAVLYFAIVDRFADGDLSNDQDVDRTARGTFHGGDLVGLRERLDEIAGLGATALWITPVVRNIPGFVTGAGFPDWAYHGYWADDFTTTDPRFGSEDDLKALVDECHRRGIRVLLDVVYNHAGYGSRYTKDPATRSWLRTEEAGTCGQDDVTSCVAGLPDFRTELPEVADYLLTAHLDMARRSGVDGFRLDTVKHVSHEFWQEHRRRTRERFGNEFFLLGEVWGGDAVVLDPWFQDDEMDAGFDFSFQGSALGWIQGRGRSIAFSRYLEKRQDVREGHLLAQFLSSHDVPTAMSLLGGDTELFRLAAVLELTVSGIPVIYYGEEVGRLGGDWPENRSDMPWGDRDVLPGAGRPRNEALREDYRRLIAIRRSFPALWRGSYRGLVFEKDLLVFSRTDGETGAEVLVAVNRGASPGSASIERPGAWAGLPLADYWNGGGLPAGEDPLELSVPARGAAILAPAGTDTAAMLPSRGEE